MDMYPVAEAKAHLSEILERVEAGARITVTRRGIPVAVIGPVSKGRPQGDIDWEALRAFRATLPMATESAVDVVRRLRDEE